MIIVGSFNKPLSGTNKTSKEFNKDIKTYILN